MSQFFLSWRPPSLPRKDRNAFSRWGSLRPVGESSSGDPRNRHCVRVPAWRKSPDLVIRGKEEPGPRNPIIFPILQMCRHVVNSRKNNSPHGCSGILKITPTKRWHVHRRRMGFVDTDAHRTCRVYTRRLRRFPRSQVRIGFHLRSGVIFANSGGWGNPAP
jgi:hypothetical protein